MLKLLAALAGPICAKELIELSRRRWCYWARLAPGAAVLICLYPVWDNIHWLASRGGTGIIQAMARAAAELFLVVCWVQYLGVYLFVPVLLCGVLAGEREARTLELLLTTQLTDREIVLGKLISRLAVTALLIWTCLPVMSLIMLFGGIDPAALVRGQLSTLLAMVFAGSFGIYYSSVSRSPITALVRTYWWLFLWLLVVPLATICVLEVSGIRPSAPTSLLLWSQALINPGFHFLAAIFSEVHDEVAKYLGGWFFPFGFLFPLLWSGSLIGRAVRRLRRPPGPSRWLAGLGTVGRALRKLWGLRLPFGTALRRLAAPWTPLGGPVRNPLWLRARLARPWDREGHLGRIQTAGWLLVLLFLGLLAVFDPHDLDDNETCMAFILLVWIGVGVVLAIVSSSGPVGDRRRGFLPLVLTTPLDARQVVDGMLLTVWEHVRRGFALVVMLYALFGLLQAGEPGALLLSLSVATAFAATVALVGLGCSLAAPNAAQPLAATFVFVLVLCAAVPTVGVMLEEQNGRVIWTTSAVLFPAAWLWQRRRCTPWTVALYLLTVHLVVVSAATWWTTPLLQWYPLGYLREELPAMVMTPAFWVLSPLDLPRADTRIGPAPWYVVAGWYSAALLAHIWWARWWLIRNFDRLTGRVTQNKPSATPVPLANRPPAAPVP